MALIDSYNTSQDLAFQHRVQTAIVQAAVNITSEVSTTTNHVNRANLAKLVTNNPQGYGVIFAAAAVTQNDPQTIQPITTSVSDADLVNIVSAVWNAVAGTN